MTRNLKRTYNGKRRVKRRLEMPNRGSRPISYKARNAAHTVKTSDFNDYHTLEEFADKYIDTCVQVAGEYNILTFNDNYISNLRKIAH